MSVIISWVLRLVDCFWVRAVLTQPIGVCYSQEFHEALATLALQKQGISYKQQLEMKHKKDLEEEAGPALVREIHSCVHKFRMQRVPSYNH